MNKKIISCIIIFSVLSFFAFTKTASSQIKGPKTTTPVLNYSLGKVHGTNHRGIQGTGYKRFESHRYERHDYDRDDHYRSDRDSKYERHGERHEKAYNRRR